MKKNIAAMAASLVMALGFMGIAEAQSDSMEEAYEANEKPLNTDSKPKTSGEINSDAGSGESDASRDAMKSVEKETDTMTNTEQEEGMRELDAEGASDAAGEAQMKE